MSDLRQPELASTPDGSKTASYADAAEFIDKFFFLGMLPSPEPRIQPRYDNAGTISAATGSVVTEQGPDFIDRSAIYIRDFGSAYKETFDEFMGGLGDSGKKAGAAVAGTVGSILPAWLWFLVGLALVGAIVYFLSPLFRRATP